MPEGDSVAGHAEMLRPILVGHTITSVDGTSPSVRVNSSHILGSQAVAVRTQGKNLIVDLDNGHSIHVHLGIPGRWRRLDPGRKPHGSARLVLTTEAGVVACYSAPTVEVDSTRSVDRRLASLGPDLLGEFDVEKFVARARTRDDRAISSVLLDQRVIAGIGNVYKSELLFLEGIHPSAHVSDVSDDQLRSLAQRAGRLLAANAGAGRRSTTGERGRGRETFVYGRKGLACRRCRTRIEMSRGGERITYWCPQCQHFPNPGPAGD